MSGTTTGPLPMTERQLHDAVVALATLLGYRHFHVYDMRRSGDGWPDLVLCRPPIDPARGKGRLIFAELKRDGKAPTEAQWGWLRDLAACGVTVRVWTPTEWRNGSIDEDLR